MGSIVVLLISPNSTTKSINISSNINSIGDYVIIASTGQILFNDNWDSNNKIIDIANLPAGICSINLYFNKCFG